MKLNSVLVCAIATLATPAALSAVSFEGEVRMKMSEPRGGAHEVAYRVKDGFVRTDIDTGGGQTASVIMDFGKKEMIILVPGQNMYMTRPLADAAAAVDKTNQGSEVTFEKTNETEKILGYECVKYISKSKDMTSDVWVTEQLGQFMGLGNGGPMGGKRGASAPAAWEKALAGKDFFPLRVVSHNLKGAEQFRLEALSVEKEPQPASVFAPPPGAQKFDMGGMMQGMGLPR